MSVRTLHTLTDGAVVTCRFEPQEPPYTPFIGLEIRDSDGAASLGATMPVDVARALVGGLLEALALYEQEQTA